jgi:cytochrome bd-type quinol oxidase subunit 2
VPIVLAYQLWVYKTFSDRIAETDPAASEAYH